MNKPTLDISVVVPLLNEAESLPELTAWIARVMQANNFTYEVLLIDDGSTDNSWEIIEQLSAQNPALKGIRFNRNYGKSAALNVGFKETVGEVVITMDADLQDSPDEIPELYRLIKVTTLFPAGKRNVTTRSAKPFLPNYSTALPANFPASNSTILTAA